MATSNKSVLLKKYAGRTKEKILQNLGKVDRTADEIFDEHLNNFTLQQNAANRLQKEFNNYIRCVRALQMASKTLMEAVTEVYEPQWSGSEALYAQSSSIEVLWQDFSHKLGDQVLIPLNTYTAQFPEMRKKIDKRGRKLVDYDSQRHSFQSLQANAAKRRDDIKLTKGRETLEEAKRTYELLNSELHDELPALHDSRILFLVTNLQTLFASEQMFHNESSKIFAELEAIVDKLATDSQRGSYTLKKINSSTPNNVPSPVKIDVSNSATYSNGNAASTNGGATTTNLPAGVLYRVKATYRYVREDTDELSFEAGDIINVVEYEDPEDQEEGWLMGYKDGSKDKGIFPANFTKPV